MIVRKITYGFVIQTYDTQDQEFVSQEFVEGDQCEYEDINGNPVDCDLIDDYLPFDMVQPKVYD